MNTLHEKDLTELAKELVTKENYMDSFRENMNMYLSHTTMKSISEKSGIPYNTLNGLVNKQNNDIKLSTVVSLAKALNVSIEELVGIDTVPQATIQSLRYTRELSDNDLYLVRWFIKHLANSKPTDMERYIRLFELEENNGYLNMSNEFTTVQMNIPKEISAKVFCGIKIPNDYYMPTYTPHNTLYIANDRPPKLTENAVILCGGHIYIAKRKIEQNKANYYSIRDKKYRCYEDEVDEVIGYIAFVQ